MSVPMRKESEVSPEEISVSVPASPSVPRRKRRNIVRRSVAFAALLAVGLGISAGAGALLPRPEPKLRLVPVSTESAKMSLQGADVQRKLGFVTVTGNALNRTPKALERVEVVIELLDANRRTIQMESALAPFQPVASGTDTPFQVVLPDNVQAVSYRVRFRQVAGAALN